MKIFLVRHGEVDNPNKVLYDRLPGFHLSEKGKREVRELADKFIANQIKIERIYHSPMERTTESAEILASKLDVKDDNVLVEKKINEVDCKEFAGKSIEYMEHNTKWGKDRLNQTAIEPIQDAGRRVMDFINEIKEDSDKNIIAFSHGDPIMGAVAMIKNDWQVVYNSYIGLADFYEVVFENNKLSVKDINTF